MPNFTWTAGLSADWSDAAGWSTGTVPNAAVAVAVLAAGAAAYTVTIAAGETETVDALTLNAANGVLTVNGSLALAGVDARLTLQAGVLRGTGVLHGGTLALAGGSLQMLGGTLDGLTVLGTLAPSRFYAVDVVGGLVVLAANGTQPGSIDLSAGALNLLDSETLDHVAITLGGPYGALQELTQGGTVTLGANARLVAAGGSFAATAGTGFDNLGSVTLDPDPSGGFPTIAANFVNGGNLLLGSLFQNRWTFAGGSLANSGSVEIAGQARLIVAAGEGFANTGAITIDNNAVLELDQNITLAALTGSGSIDNAGGQIVLGGTVGLGGGTIAVASGGLFASLTLSGTARGGTLAIADGVLALPGATLDGVTILGTLNLSANNNNAISGGYSVTALNGLGFAGGQSALVANGGVLTLVASQTLDHLAISLGYGSTGVKTPVPRSTGLNGAGLVAQATLDLGSAASIATLGSAYITAASFANAGRITVAAGNDMLIAAAQFANSGSIAIGANATLELDIGATLPVLTAAAGAIANNGGTLILSGTMALAGSAFDAATAAANLGNIALLGLVQGGTIRPDSALVSYGVPTVTGGQFFMSGLTLDGDTVQGKLDLTAAADAAGIASSIAIAGGIVLQSAGGGQPGSIDLSAGQIVLLDSETLDQAGILLGAAGVSPAAAAITDGGAGNSLTLGGHAVVSVAGSATIAVGGFSNAGTIELAGSLMLAATGIAANSGTIAGSGTLVAAVALVNTGLMQAIAGGTLAVGSSLQTLAGPTQAGGTYEAQANAVLDLSLATPLATDAATILLDGPGAVLASYNAAKGTFQTIETTLRSIATTGTLAVLGGRSFAATNSLAVAGLLQLGGGSLTAPGVTLTATGRLLGAGHLAGPVANAGSIEASGGLLAIGALSGAGSLLVDPSGTLELAAGVAAETVDFNGVGGTLRLDGPSYAGTLAGLAPGDVLVLAQTSASAAAIVGNSLSVTLAAGGTLQYALSGVAANGGATVRTDGAGNAVIGLATPPIGQQNPCFLQGTRILTARGEIPVEALRVGDRVPGLRGRPMAEIRWIGHRRVDCRRHPKPPDVQPVRIAAEAFGPDLPHRALFLSPDHAVFTGGALIPVRYLVNGSSVARVAHDFATYWHVELDAHGVMLAEGLPAESYLDTGNRGAFGGEVPELHPDFARRIWRDQGCAPLVAAGAELAAARAVLRSRATELGHVLLDDPDLHVGVAGQIVRPVLQDGRHRFDLPPGTAWLRLASRVTVPAEHDAEGVDHRRLGVAVTGLWLDGRPCPPDRLGEGWHAAEPGWRWTDGAAAIDGRGARRLEVASLPIGAYWQSPPETAAAVSPPVRSARPESAGRPAR